MLSKCHGRIPTDSRRSKMFQTFLEELNCRSVTSVGVGVSGFGFIRVSGLIIL